MTETSSPPSSRTISSACAPTSTAVPQRVSAPIVAECGLHFECKTLLTQDMTGDQMDDEIIRLDYPERDFHTMFFGEIVDCYTTDD